MRKFRYIIAIAILTCFTLPSTSFAGWLDRFFGYGSYEECILDRMEGVTSDVAARQIRAACKKLTAENNSGEEACDEIFTSEDRRGITGQGQVITDTFFADIYNPNRYMKISKIEVSIEGTSNNKSFKRDLMLPRGSPLLPLSSGKFMGSIGLRPEVGFSWSINTIYGCKAN